MLKGHQSYLRRIIKIAVSDRYSDRMLDKIGRIATIKAPIYQLMRDIVCDIRFYSVISDDPIWKEYSIWAISEFLDSLTEDDWCNEEQRTGKKEDFLNAWFARHIMPMSMRKRNKMVHQLNLARALESQNQQDEYDVITTPVDDAEYPSPITDMTEADVRSMDNLPNEVLRYAKFDNMPGQLSDPHTTEVRFLDTIDPELLKLAKKIGRSGAGAPIESKGKFQTASRSDISGITLGDNLSSLLPTELAMLASPSSEKVFLKRYVQKRLQVFSSASSSLKSGVRKAGPIYICVDTSGSMSGSPERIAKTLALAISIIAQRERRPICMVNYSHSLSYFVLTDLNVQRREFISFLSYSYNGGNDEDMLFDFLFNKLPDIPKYRMFADAFAGADLLVISDFEWAGISARNEELINQARAGGMKFYALKIEMPEDFFHGLTPELIAEFSPMDSEFEYPEFMSDSSPQGGEKFFGECDYRYVHRNGHIYELQ